jgi:hypothetical protein
MAVYQESKSELIPMTGVEGVNYRVFVGTVNWGDGQNRHAACVLIQKGSTKDWKLALGANEVIFTIPAHILNADVEAVAEAVVRLKRNHLPPTP